MNRACRKMHGLQNSWEHASWWRGGASPSSQPLKQIAQTSEELASFRARAGRGMQDPKSQLAPGSHDDIAAIRDGEEDIGDMLSGGVAGDSARLRQACDGNVPAASPA